MSGVTEFKVGQQVGFISNAGAGVRCVGRILAIDGTVATVGRELKQKVQLQDLLPMSERQGVNSDGKNVFFNSPFFDPRLIGEDEKAGNPLYVDPNSTPQSNRISIPARPEARPESWHVYDTGSGKNGVVNPDYLDLHPRLPSRCEHGVMSHDPETGTPIYICQQCAWIRRGGVEKRKLGPPDPVGEPRIIEIDENPNRDWRISWARHKEWARHRDAERHAAGKLRRDTPSDGTNCFVDCQCEIHKELERVPVQGDASGQVIRVSSTPTHIPDGVISIDRPPYVESLNPCCFGRVGTTAGRGLSQALSRKTTTSLDRDFVKVGDKKDLSPHWGDDAANAEDLSDVTYGDRIPNAVSVTSDNPVAEPWDSRHDSQTILLLPPAEWKDAFLLYEIQSQVLQADRMNGSGTIEKPRYARIAEEIRTQYALQKWQPPVPIETSGDHRDIGVLRTTQNDVTQRLRSITEHQVREYHERAEQLVRDSGTVRYNI